MSGKWVLEEKDGSTAPYLKREKYQSRSSPGHSLDLSEFWHPQRVSVVFALVSCQGAVVAQKKFHNDAEIVPMAKAEASRLALSDAPYYCDVIGEGVRQKALLWADGVLP